MRLRRRGKPTTKNGEAGRAIFALPAFFIILVMKVNLIYHLHLIQMVYP